MTNLDALIEAVEAGDADACDSACRDMHRTKHEKGSGMSDPIGYGMGEPISELVRKAGYILGFAIGKVCIISLGVWLGLL
jgi:hypothetical protein